MIKVPPKVTESGSGYLKLRHNVGIHNMKLKHSMADVPQLHKVTNILEHSERTNGKLGKTKSKTSRKKIQDTPQKKIEDYDAENSKNTNVAQRTQVHSK